MGETVGPDLCQGKSRKTLYLGLWGKSRLERKDYYAFNGKHDESKIKKFTALWFSHFLLHNSILLMQKLNMRYKEGLFKLFYLFIVSSASKPLLDQKSIIAILPGLPREQ